MTRADTQVMKEKIREISAMVNPHTHSPRSCPECRIIVYMQNAEAAVCEIEAGLLV